MCDQEIQCALPVITTKLKDKYIHKYNKLQMDL